METITNKHPKADRSRTYREQLITVEDLERFKDDLIVEIKNLLTPLIQEDKKWIKSSEVRKMLGISPGTLQNLRINGTLPFTKIGGTLYFDYEDIKKVLSTNRVHNSI
jgi:hypothetical protein